MNEKRVYAVWKFPLLLQMSQTVKMPLGAEILSVQFQEGVLTAWAKVRHGRGNEDRKIEIRGTGHTIEEEVGCDGGMYLNHLATVQGEAGFVWHVFEQIGEKEVGSRTAEAQEKMK